MANAKRRSGIDPLSYLGVDPVTPPMLVIESRAPTANDYASFNVGTLWVIESPTRQIWMLIDKDAGTADWVQIYPAGGGAGGASNFQTDVGVAIQVAGNLDVLGGSNINTAGVGQIITVNLEDSVILIGSLTAGTSLLSGTTITAGTSINAGTSVNAMTTVTGGTGITATTGNITAATGDVVATAGDVTATAGDLNALVGTVNALNAELTVAAGDPFVHFDIGGGQDYSFGIDDSDSDSLKITDDTDPSTGNDLWVMTANGERTLPVQPAFLAENIIGALNVTGNNVEYTIIYENVVTDRAANYNNVTGVFTAPITGLYLLSAGCLMTNVNGATFGQLSIRTTGRVYRSNLNSPDKCFSIDGANNSLSYKMSVIADLAAGNTAYVTIHLNGQGANNADVGPRVNYNKFSGFLLG